MPRIFPARAGRLLKANMNAPPDLKWRSQQIDWGAVCDYLRVAQILEGHEQARPLAHGARDMRIELEEAGQRDAVQVIIELLAHKASDERGAHRAGQTNVPAQR